MMISGLGSGGPAGQAQPHEKSKIDDQQSIDYRYHAATRPEP
ncbi:hypothetical protein [Candidimonas nitroreducens]|nr:hypothetical protein [Candidimonas nitroreducens]